MHKNHEYFTIEPFYYLPFSEKDIFGVVTYLVRRILMSFFRAIFKNRPKNKRTESHHLLIHGYTNLLRQIDYHGDLSSEVFRNNGIKIMKEDFPKFLITAIGLIKAFEFRMFPLKPIEKNLDTAELLIIYI